MAKHIYLEMTWEEVKALKKDQTVLLSAISPVEVHGPHLPIGTDIYIAENLRDRIGDMIMKKHPEFDAVILPTLPLGADAIPFPGSFKLDASAIERTVKDWSGSLASQGFKYWVLCDNHGGPHHQMAIQSAAIEMRKKGFHLIAPFSLVFRRMVGLDPDLTRKTGLDRGHAGDMTDAHAGTNETSIMLAARPELVREKYKELGPGRISPPRGFNGVLGQVGKALDSAGLKYAGEDFYFISHALAWIDDPDMDCYQGTPRDATAQAGEKMLNYHAETAVELFEQALAGKQADLKPLGWSIRALRKLI